MHILIGNNPAYSRFMHLHVIGYIPQYEGFKMIDAFIKKLLLKLDDTLRNPVDCFLSLLDAFYQPAGGLHLFLDVSLTIVTGKFIVHARHNITVVIADAQLRQAIIIKDYLVFVSCLKNINIWYNALSLLIRINTARFWIHAGNQHDCLYNFRWRNLQFPGNTVIIFFFQSRQMFLNYSQN